MKCLIPSNLPHEKIDKATEKRRPEYKHKIYKLISLIARRRYTDNRAKYNKYLLISFKTIVKRVGFGAKEVVDLAEKLGILDIDKKFIIGEKCRGYRLKAPYCNSKIVLKNDTEVKQNTWETIEELPFKDKKSREEEYLLNNFQAVTIEKQDIFRESLEATLRNELLEAKTQKQKDNAYHKYNSRLISFEMIIGGDWFSSQDLRTGRVFNNATNASKELRSKFLYQGRHLVEIDIKNCQPFLMYNLYKSKNVNESWEFRKIVEAGEFYEKIADESRLNRKESKESFMYFAYGVAVEEANESKFGKAFRKLFPILAAICDDIKKEDYTDLALKLQKLEANWIIDNVVNKLIQKNIFIISVHDALLVLPEAVEEVVAIVVSECKKLYGLTPQVSVSYNNLD